MSNAALFQTYAYSWFQNFPYLAQTIEYKKPQRSFNPNHPNPGQILPINEVIDHIKQDDLIKVVDLCNLHTPFLLAIADSTRNSLNKCGEDFKKTKRFFNSLHDESDLQDKDLIEQFKNEVILEIEYNKRPLQLLFADILLDRQEQPINDVIEAIIIGETLHARPTVHQQRREKLKKKLFQNIQKRINMAYCEK